MNREDYFAERTKRTLSNEINYVLNNPEKGKERFPATSKILEDMVLERFSDLDHIMVLEKSIEIFTAFRKEMKDLLPNEKKLKLNQLIELFTTLIETKFDEQIIQERLKELTPQYTEIIDFLLKEREKSIGKRSFYWIGSLKKLSKLHSELISNNLISNDTTLENFTKVFTYNPISEITKIKWTEQSGLLAYFIDELNFQKRFKFSVEIFSIARDCFTNANNLSKLKYQYLGNKKGFPRNNHIIDNILKSIEHPS